MSESNAGASSAASQASSNSQGEGQKVDSTSAPIQQGQASSIEASQEGVNSLEEAAQEAKAEKKKEEALKKKYKLKVDGQEFEEEIDFSNEDDIVKRLQLAKAAQKRMQETTQMKKALQEFLANATSNPEYALEQLGIDPLHFAEERIRREIEEKKKSPEQKEFEKQQKELEDYKKKLEKFQKEKEQAEMQALEEKYHRQIEDEIVSAIDKVNDIPKSAYFVKRVSDLMASFIRSGKTDVTANDVVPLVRKQIKQELKDLYGSASEDILEELWGKSNVDRLRKKRLAKARDAKKLQSTRDIKPTGVRPESNEPRKKTSMNDFFRKLK